MCTRIFVASVRHVLISTATILLLFSSLYSNAYADPICGDGVIEALEQCDDGNTLSGDGCTASCSVEQQCYDAGNTFSFFIWSDSYTSSGDTAVMKIFTDAVDAAKYPTRVLPRLWISTGDIPFMQDGNGRLDQLNDTISNSAGGQRYPFTCSASNGKFPYYVAIGNHDVDGYTSLTPQSQYDYWNNYLGPRLPGALLGTQNFRWGPGSSYNNRTTYSFDYKNAHIIVVNQYLDDPSYPTSNPLACIRQNLYDWIDQDLASTSRPIRFIFGHEPAWSYCSNLGGFGGTFCPLGSIDNQNPASRPRPYSTTGDWTQPFGHHWGDSLDSPLCPSGSRDGFWSMLARHNVVAHFVGHTHSYSARLVEGNGTRRNDVSAYGKTGQTFVNTEGVWEVDSAQAHNSAGAAYVLTTVRDNTVTFEAYDQIGASETFKLIETWSVNVGNAPLVTLAAPGEGAVLPAGASISLSANATDLDGSVTQVSYFANGTLLGSASVSPYTVIWDNVPAGNYALTARATDNVGLSNTSQAVNISVVNTANNAPVLSSIADLSGNEASLLSFTATASDADGHALSFSLINAPAGTSIGTINGVFSWTPTESQGPGAYHFIVRATDNGAPALTADQPVTITVNEVNTAPVLAAIGSKTVQESSLLTFTASASDADIPANNLSYSLVNAPSGASINPSSGSFSWTPAPGQAGVYTFDVRVTDNGSPALSASQSVSVTVTANLNQLQNGVPISGLSASIGNAVRYTLEVPAGATNLNFNISGGSGDADLYVRFGTAPTLTAYDCRPYIDGNNENCSFAAPTAGTWHVMVQAYATFSGVTLVASYTGGGPNTPPVANAGPDQTVLGGAAVTLPGSGSDPGGSIASYAWTQTAGPAVTLSGATTATASFVAPNVTSPAVLSFQLTVTDNQGATGSDSVNVTVNVNNLKSDLLMTALSTATTTTSPGFSFSVSDTAANLGSNSAGAFLVAFSLSADAIYGGVNDTAFSQTRAVSGLAIGATSSASTTVTVPAGIATGAYYLCAIADSANTVDESSETNNTRCTPSTIQVSPPSLPDLVMSALSTTTTSVKTGKSLTLSHDVRNQGNSDASKFVVELHLSSDANYGGNDDVVLKTRSIGSLKADNVNSSSTKVTIPSSTVAGNYFLCAAADSESAITESNEDNNTRCTLTTVQVTQ